MADVRTPPQFVEGERAILGGLLIDNEALPRAIETVKPAHFYRQAHRLVYAAIVALFEKGEPVDWVTLTAALNRSGHLDECGGTIYLAELADAVPSAANILHYCEVVKEMALRRQIISASSENVQDAFDESKPVEEVIDRAEHRIFAIGEAHATGAAVRMTELMHDSLAIVETLYERKEAITGVPSGFRDLDLLTAGFQPSNLVIVAGRPSMGKTSLALNVALYAAVDAGIPTGIFSLEMSKEELGLRCLCTRAHVNLRSLRTGYIADSEWPRLTAAAGLLAQAPILIDDTPAISTLDLRARARRLKREYNLGLLIVDYLQLMSGSGRRQQDREEEVSEISRNMKALAKELNLPVIALSQLNRKCEDRADKRPQLADLRESGAIEQDADMILFVYRDEMYNKAQENPKRGEAEIIIGKQRNGPVGTVKLTFNAGWSSFLPRTGRDEAEAAEM